MYILTTIEHEVLKSIRDHLAARGIDPVMSPVRIDQFPCKLDYSQMEVAINAMVVFRYVTKIGRHIAMTAKGVEVLKNASLFGNNRQGNEKDMQSPENDSGKH